MLTSTKQPQERLKKKQKNTWVKEAREPGIVEN